MSTTSPDKWEFPDPPAAPSPSLVTRILSHMSVSNVGYLILVLVYLFYKGGKMFCVRFYSVPPDNYREDFKAAIEGNGLVNRGKVGMKGSSFRRRLILASVKPQQYSTVPLVTTDDTDCTNPEYQRIRICRADKENREEFEELLKPQTPEFPLRRIIYGFFHPYSYAGGGGERVLWDAVYVTLKKSPSNLAMVYTFTAENSQSVSSILTDVKQTFGIDLFEPGIKDRVILMQLPNKYRWIVDGRSYKFFTMAFQALGSIALLFMAMSQCPPDVFIDTLGLPACYPFVIGWMDIPVTAYVHYPWVSTDMLHKLKLQMKKRPLLVFKWIYWQVLIKLYSAWGSFLCFTMCNSTWTQNNLVKAWTWAENEYLPEILYPPTGIDESKIDTTGDREHFFLYIAQFRPEKRHDLLLNQYAEYAKGKKEAYKLVLAGTTRSDEDKQTVDQLKAQASELEVEDLITFKVNSPREVIDDLLHRAEFGINTMWNEHFGITVVEYMLNGAIPIVHASGGPLLDIVVPIHDGELVSKDTIKIEDSDKSGFFFQDPSDPDYGSTPEKYKLLSQVFEKATSLSETEKAQYRSNAIAVSDKKFAKHVFQEQWAEEVDSLAYLESAMRDKRDKVTRLY